MQCCVLGTYGSLVAWNCLQMYARIIITQHGPDLPIVSTVWTATAGEACCSIKGKDISQ